MQLEYFPLQLIQNPNSATFFVAALDDAAVAALLGSSPQTSYVLCSETWSTAAAGLPGCSLSCTGPEKGRKIIHHYIHALKSCSFWQPDVSCKPPTKSFYESKHPLGKICNCKSVIYNLILWFVITEDLGGNSVEQ